MADTTIHPSARAAQWDANFFLEYVRSNKYARYMGTSMNSVIQVNERLTGNKGDTIYCTLYGALRGPHNNGTTALVGNEKQQFNYAWGSVVAPVRDAVTINNMEYQAAGSDARAAARQGLRNLSVDYLRDHITQAMDDRTGSSNIAEGAGPINEDQWAAANQDRSVYAGGAYSIDFATSVASATSVMSSAIMTEAKLAARTAGGGLGTNDRASVGRIQPVRINEEEEWFVHFMGSVDFANLKADTVIQAANREAWQRYGGQARDGGSGGNPLFRGGDIVFDGIIAREIPEIDDLTPPGSGKKSSFLCGAQAVACCWAQRTRTTLKKEDDYGFSPGVGFDEIRAISKMHWEGASATDLQQWGMVSVFTAES